MLLCTNTFNLNTTTMQTQEVKSAKICPGRGARRPQESMGPRGEEQVKLDKGMKRMHRRRLSVANVTAERRRAFVSQQRHVVAGPLTQWQV